jgi:hypothetical protein
MPDTESIGEDGIALTFPERIATRSNRISREKKPPSGAEFESESTLYARNWISNAHHRDSEDREDRSWANTFIANTSEPGFLVERVTGHYGVRMKFAPVAHNKRQTRTP